MNNNILIDRFRYFKAVGIIFLIPVLFCSLIGLLINDYTFDFDYILLAYSIISIVIIAKMDVAKIKFAIFLFIISLILGTTALLCYNILYPGSGPTDIRFSIYYFFISAAFQFSPKNSLSYLCQLFPITMNIILVVANIIYNKKCFLYKI